MTVGAVDDAPIAFVDTATVGEDSAATVIDVLANDIDIDGGPKTIAAITQPGHGTVAITGGGTGLTFTPDANFNGSDLFTYTLNSGSPATVNVTVVAADDPPDAVDDTIPDSPEDGGVRTILGAALLANDSDPDNLAGAPNAGLTVTAAGNAVGGSVAVVAGDVQFTPDPSFNGPAWFEYTIDDGTGRTDTATASFDITPGWLWS